MTHALTEVSLRPHTLLTEVSLREGKGREGKGTTAFATLSCSSVACHASNAFFYSAAAPHNTGRSINHDSQPQTDETKKGQTNMSIKDTTTVDEFIRQIVAIHFYDTKIYVHSAPEPTMVCEAGENRVLLRLEPPEWARHDGRLYPPHEFADHMEAMAEDIIYPIPVQAKEIVETLRYVPRSHWAPFPPWENCNRLMLPFGKLTNVGRVVIPSFFVVRLPSWTAEHPVVRASVKWRLDPELSIGLESIDDIGHEMIDNAVSAVEKALSAPGSPRVAFWWKLPGH